MTKLSAASIGLLSALLILLSGLLLPAQAQFKFAPGSYTLTDGSRHEGTLKFVLAGFLQPAKLKIKEAKGAQGLDLEQVSSFDTDNHRFQRVDDFPFPGGYDSNHGGPVFMELIESGEIELFAYHYTFQAGNYVAEVVLPVLHQQGTSAYSVLNSDDARGIDVRNTQQARESVALLFDKDPELQKRILAGAVVSANIVQYVRAYNSGAKQPSGPKATQ